MKLFKVFFLLLFLYISSYAASTTCPGQIVSNLEGTTVNAVDSDSGYIANNDTYYYNFTPSVNGTIEIDAWVARSFNVSIKDGCSGSVLWYGSGSNTHVISSAQNVSSGQQIVITLTRPYSSSRQYNIDFTFTASVPAPQINLQGNGNDISNGDTSPTTWDDTDFGSISLGNSVTHTFTIENPGTQTLVLTNSPLVTASGDFTVTSQPSTNSIAPGGSTSFEVTFSPTAYGNRTGSISIANNVSGSNPYTFSITGEGLDPVLSCPGRVITNLDGTSISATDSDSGVIPAYSTYYYYFTPATDGSIQVNTEMGVSYNSLYIRNGCSTTLISDTSNSNSKSLSYDISAGDQIVIAYERRYTSDQSYTIDFIFTAFVATANDDSYSVLPNNTLTGNVLTNDLGPNISITSYTNPTNGTLILGTDGTFSYVPATDYEGTDTFTYEIEDSNGITSNATVTITVALATNYGGFHAFERVNPENTRYVRGNYAIAGNTVTCLTALTSGYADASDICHGQTDYTDLTSNNRVNKYLDIDGDSSTWNSTSSYVVLPDTYDPAANRGVLWAGLFWQGRISNDNDYSKHYAKVNGSSYDYTETKGASSIILENTNANKIKLKINSGSYLDVQASTVYKEESDGDVTYAAYADVTSKIKAANLIAGKQIFTVANLTTEIGREGNPGLFGGWSLVVIYAEDLYGEVRNISVLSGFDEVGNPSAAFPITGLKLPKTGTVNSSLSLFAGEGETLYSPDWVKISGDGSSYDYMPGAAHNTNIFDAVFTGILRDSISGEYNDLALNNNGVDVDTFDVSAQVQQYRDDNPNLNTLYMQWSSGQDYITPSMIAFATQLYEPKLCYDYSIKQDGHYLKLDRTTSTIASVTGRISSSPLEIEVYLRNEEADLPAEGVSFRTDVNTTMFNQIGDLYTSNIDGSVLFDRGAPQFTSPLCDYNLLGNNNVDNVGCTDGHNIRKGNGILDAYDYVYTKFLLKPNVSGLSDINESLGLSIDYYITASGFTIPYLNYIIGGPNVPICPPSDAYIPEFGQFNVVSNGSIYNNLNTQISRKPFDVDVIFDSDPSTGVNDAPTSDLNSTVLVEIIDVDAFGDLNASCANPDAAVSAWPVFVPLQYTPSLWQTQVPPQPSSFFNFATQNATYRVWYFDDGNGTLIENWTANTANNGKDLLSISGLYNSSVHTVCAAACSDDTNVGCFTCIRDNYAKPLCARDNFSVRPESYDMRVYDINNSLSTYDIVADPTNVKNLTKVDLSTLHNQIPSQPIINGTPLELAAGYDYRYDVNATGYDSLNGIPGYTREFTTNSDYNVTMYWNGPNGTFCNDTSDLSLSFYIANGVLMNQEEQHTNVGDYFVNIIDRTWTIVDWDSSLMTHHLNGGFNPVQAFDCDTTSSTTVTNGLHGCTITSNQPTAGSGIYRDIPLTFHPYTFDITNTLSVGPENKPLSDKSFVYMNNIDNDENMSVHLNSFVTARGLSNANALTNFVTGCYATDVNFTIAKSTTTANNIAYRYIAHDLNATGDRIVGADLNGTIAAGNTTGNPLLLIPSTYWNKNMNGVLNLETNLNFNRAVNVAVNPEDINFTTLQADDNATLFNADLISNKTANGSATVGQSVMHYYGKTNAPTVTITCNTLPCRSGTHASSDSTTQELISFAIYCVGTCPTGAVLPLGSVQTNDTRWWINPYHDTNVTIGVDGIIGTITEALGSGTITEVSRLLDIANYRYESVLEYNGPLPYDAPMLMQSSPWLIYNESDPAATQNDFIIQFIGGGGWSGMYEKDSTTQTTGAPASGRIMW